MLTQGPSDSTILVLTCDIPAPPAVVYGAWTQPSEIVRWWPQEAEIDARVGGAVPFRLASDQPASAGDLSGG